MKTVSRRSIRIGFGVILLAVVAGLFHQQITGHVACAAEKSGSQVAKERPAKQDASVTQSPKEGTEHNTQAVKEPAQDHLVRVEELSTTFRQVAQQAQPAVVYIIAQYIPKKTEGQDPEPGSAVDELPEILRKFFEERGDIPRRWYYRSPDEQQRDPHRELPVPRRPQPQRRQGLGSGVIIDAANGYIITNNHVVETGEGEEARFDVYLADGRRVEGKVVGRDPSTDLAVVQIKAEDLHALSLGDSDQMEVGDWVLAIGSPFKFQQTVTQGIISAKGRNPGIVTGYEDFIQTDAAINPGNSGGPLVNMRGEVIGINTAIVTSGLVHGFMGIGFAVPAKTVKYVLPFLKEGKEVVRGYLGVKIRGLDTYPPGIGKTFGLAEDVGVQIEGFKPDRPDTPARKAGLKIDDVILEYNGQRVKSSTQLQSFVALTEPGTTVQLKVWRDREEITIPVQIEKQPPGFFEESTPWSSREGGREEREPDNPEIEIEVLGMTVQLLTPALAKQYGWEDQKDTAGLLVVTKLDPLGEASAGLGIEVGDLLLSVQGIPVHSGQALLDALNEEALAEGVRLRIQSVRSRESRTVYLEINR